jgi:multisubunit Na+/H+ antiporter MnhC subunit
MLQPSHKLIHNRDYAAKVFGFATFGKVYGLIICLAGLLNFSQSALDAATHDIFHGDPLPVNIILLSSALLVGIALVSFVFKKSHKIHRENIEEEAESAREVLMPDAKRNGMGARDYGAIGGSNGNGNGNTNGNGIGNTNGNGNGNTNGNGNGNTNGNGNRNGSPSGDEEQRGRRI